MDRVGWVAGWGGGWRRGKGPGRVVLDLRPIQKKKKKKGEEEEEEDARRRPTSSKVPHSNTATGTKGSILNDRSTI